MCKSNEKALRDLVKVVEGLNWYGSGWGESNPFGRATNLLFSLFFSFMLTYAQLLRVRVVFCVVFLAVWRAFLPLIYPVWLIIYERISLVELGVYVVFWGYFANIWV